MSRQTFATRRGRGADATRRRGSGVASLLRLALRRDRILIAVTLVLVWALNYYSAEAMGSLYPHPADLVAANTAANASTGVVAMYGHISDVGSVGGVGSTKMAMINFIILAFLVVALVRRHTRAEEETGRQELIGSAPIARHAPLTAAVLLAGATSVACGLVTWLCVWAGGWPSAGSMLYGLALAGVGLSFTGITAVAVQLSANNRTCGIWAFSAIGLSFVLRMIGDVYWNRPAHVLSWLSPLGWGQQVRPYDGNHAWALVVPLAFFAATVALAFVLLSHRDLGAGLFAERAGTAHTRMGSAAALAWRLQRGSFIAWLACYVIFGALAGGMSGSMQGMINADGEAMLRAMGGVGHLNDLYFTLISAFAALGAAAYGVATVLRMRSEESSGHLEQLLATPLTRTRFAGSYQVQAVLGSAVLVALLGATAATLHTTSPGGGGWRRVFSGALIGLPGIWLLTALAFVALAWLPRLDWLGWAFLGWVVVVDELGALLKFPGWLLKASPFAHLPKLPVEPMTWAPVLVITALAAVLVAIGFVGYRRRDMPVV
ncbi:ABC transporter permease [Propionibacterium freudenreichii]|uniref:ABC transporter permease n=1 Tax=Propionibacterium freudenreichii TaxID=1744 RepID=UPI0021A4D8C7|nr:hypothetical protein [Propionibacterium freudenreichii]MDK9651736.1 polyketide antibiotic transporter [Propionibacterium freudenreichii]MDK9665272.1 polyketide antibiotic transporter [Propionibacterium freudenreichii]MDN5961944.1 hypothetical protein [Propionibacterium sp.]